MRTTGTRVNENLVLSCDICGASNNSRACRIVKTERISDLDSLR
jgi:hypothetical protein